MNDEEIQETAESESAAYGIFAQDEAFCVRMRWAIAAGLEHAPIGVVTTPGTKNPRYVPAKPRPLSSSQRAMEHA
jgi:hypothetical protein